MKTIVLSLSLILSSLSLWSRPVAENQSGCYMEKPIYQKNRLYEICFENNDIRVSFKAESSYIIMRLDITEKVFFSLDYTVQPYFYEEDNHYVYYYSTTIPLFSKQSIPHFRPPMPKKQQVFNPKPYVNLDSDPNFINPILFNKLICSHPMLVYTGSRFSELSGVPPFKELQKILKLSEDEDYTDWLYKALKKPFHIASFVHRNYMANRFAKPARAHLSLNTIIKSTQSYLVTENLDYLHEMTGQAPLRLATYSKVNIPAHKHLLNYDYLFIIGLDDDTFGLIHWYKENKPKGKIVYLGKTKPTFLDDRDFWIADDIEKALLQIEELL